MTVILTIVYYLLLLYIIVLWGRFVLDLVQSFNRQWRPRGVALVTAHVVYSLTDPPLKALRRLIPPLRLGGISLDLGFIILFIAVYIGMSVTGGLA